MNLLIALGRNPGILALARLLVGRRSLITGAKSFFSRGVFSPALGVLSSQLAAMPKAKVAELLALAGLLATEYHRSISTGRANPDLETHLDENTHYFKLREVLSKANPYLEQWTPIVSPLLASTGYGLPVAGLLNMATKASGQSRSGAAVTAFGPAMEQLIPMFDGQLHFLREGMQQLKARIEAVKQQIRAQEKRLEQRASEREATRRARELERTLSAQQVAAIANRPTNITVEVPEVEQTEEEFLEDVHYSLFKKKKGKGKKRRALRSAAETELAELQEQLKQLQEQEREEEKQWQEQQHAATLERVMRLSGGAQPAESEYDMGPSINDFNNGRYDGNCCCNPKRLDWELVETSPQSLTGYPRYDNGAGEDEKNRVIYIRGGLFQPLDRRLDNYRAWANKTGAPHPEDVLADIINNTEADCSGCCKDEHDYDCSCCTNKDAYDTAFEAAGRLPSGPFFSSSWVNAKLGDLPEGTYGMVHTGKRPFEVTINRNVDLPRAQVSFAHEMLHVMNDLHKLGLPHDQLHNAAVMLVGEVLPGLNALTEAAK